MIKWEDPPEDGRTSYARKSELHAAMRSNPGKWLVWSDSASNSVGTQLRRQGYETRTVLTGNNRRVKVYARWPENAEQKENHHAT